MNSNGRTSHALAYSRWSAPKASPRRNAAEVDEAGQALARLARSILERAPHVLREVTSGSHSAVRRQAYADRPEVEDRAWRVSYENIEAFCVVDSQDERALLGLTVGGVLRGRLSEIERRIVGEAVGRLFGASTLVVPDIYEELRQRPVPPSWNCTVELHGPAGLSAQLSLFTPLLAVPRPSIVRPKLDAVSLPLRATIPPTLCDLASIGQWRSGALVRLRRGHDGAYALLYAGSQRLARAQLGSLFGERAVRLTEMLAGGS